MPRIQGPLLLPAVTLRTVNLSVAGYVMTLNTAADDAALAALVAQVEAQLDTMHPGRRGRAEGALLASALLAMAVEVQRLNEQIVALRGQVAQEAGAALAMLDALQGPGSP